MATTSHRPFFTEDRFPVVGSRVIIPKRKGGFREEARAIVCAHARRYVYLYITYCEMKPSIVGTTQAATAGACYPVTEKEYHATNLEFQNVISVMIADARDVRPEDSAWFEACRNFSRVPAKIKPVPFFSILSDRISHIITRAHIARQSRETGRALRESDLLEKRALRDVPPYEPVARATRVMEVPQFPLNAPLITRYPRRYKMDIEQVIPSWFFGASQLPPVGETPCTTAPSATVETHVSKMIWQRKPAQKNLPASKPCADMAIVPSPVVSMSHSSNDGEGLSTAEAAPRCRTRSIQLRRKRERDQGHVQRSGTANMFPSKARRLRDAAPSRHDDATSGDSDTSKKPPPSRFARAVMPHHRGRASLPNSRGSPPNLVEVTPLPPKRLMFGDSMHGSGNRSHVSQSQLQHPRPTTVAQAQNDTPADTTTADPACHDRQYINTILALEGTAGIQHHLAALASSLHSAEIDQINLHHMVPLMNAINDHLSRRQQADASSR